MWLDKVPVATEASIMEDLVRLWRNPHSDVEDAREVYARALDPMDAYKWRATEALTKKDRSLCNQRELEDLAISAFLESERNCAAANNRLSEVPPDGETAAVLHMASRKISLILGDVPPLYDLPFCFGPGANTSVGQRDASPQAKLSAELMCSESLFPVAEVFLREMPGLFTGCEYRDISVDSGKLVFVPKSRTSLRSIVVEPLLNGLCQKGVGTYMKRRLLKHGVNLYDQTINQKLARAGSLDGSYATIDLSAASDSICTELVNSLLPLDWSALLGVLRTGVIEFRGTEVRLEKFSSMGNGYTFELESLLFYGLANAVCEYLDVEGVVSVYGDDIIVPTEAAETLIRVLRYCGFKTNVDKTFVEGPFRESCGADYLRGIDIRPVYKKDRWTWQSLFAFHNELYRHHDLVAAALIRKYIPDPLFIGGPDGYGDGHLLGVFYDFYRTRKARRRGYGGWFFDTFVPTARRDPRVLPGDARLPGYTVYVRSGESSPTDIAVRRGVKGYRRVSMYTLVLPE